MVKAVLPVLAAIQVLWVPTEMTVCLVLLVKTELMALPELQDIIPSAQMKV